MAFNTGNNELDSISNNLLRRLIDAQKNKDNQAGQRRSIRETMFHDFAAYRLLIQPEHITFTGAEHENNSNKEPPVNLDIWNDFDWFLNDFPDTFSVAIEYMVAVEEVTLVDESFGSGIVMGEHVKVHQEIRTEIEPRIAEFTKVFRATMGLVLLELFESALHKQKFLETACEAVQNWFVGELRTLQEGSNSITEEEFLKLQSVDFWAAGIPKVVNLIGQFDTIPPAGPEEQLFGDALPPNYAFTPFTPGSVNFGFRMLYRQTWTPLGTQSGEVIRTLPLGPRQSEKIGIKVVNTMSSSRVSETNLSVETSTEATVSSKDSTDIVKEASGNFNWDVSLDVSVPIDIAQVGVGGGIGGELASSSRDTKSNLNETMKKTASKLRSDTKIVVSLARESTNERSHYSEIVNPNDEIAVTYVYSRLQRRYEVQSQLVAVDNVIYVAEHVPAPKEITGEWIRRYDWIISRVLLDESFHSDLEVIRNHESSQTEVESIDANIGRLMQWLTNRPGGAAGIPDYSSVSGTIPDLFANLQQAYEREVERERARKAEQETYRRSVRRLRGHLYDNILHYCHAIWSSEDPNARYLRYRKIRVPVRWDFVSSETPRGHVVEGDFTPAVGNPVTDTAMLADLVDPAGPIGYCGNYAVFKLRAGSEWPSLLSMMDLARLPFLCISVSIEHEDSERQKSFTCFAAANTTRMGERKYRLDYEQEGDRSLFRIFGESAPNTNMYVEVDRLPYSVEGYLEFDALRVWITPASDSDVLRAGDVFFVSVRQLLVLEDPERRSIIWTAGPLSADDQAAFFNPDVIQRFGNLFADCAYALAKLGKSDPDWANLPVESRTVLVDRYFDYLLKSRHTEHILVDSNDVILTREVDTDSSLEPFKSLHRYIDALTAFEDMTAKELENQRVRARLQANLLGDPDVDRLTVISSGTSETPFATPTHDSDIDSNSDFDDS